ncbi:hypothetical protein [Thalassobacillus sp. B23F22_16]|uniref:hypothetical protein n=1 Tax=Thalassobacillus sp. B23F22_16 TaxID=3459513 RepID=UPI00373EA40D
MGILLYIVSIFIFYLVIKAAVRDGINSSRIGERLEKEEETRRASKKGFLQDDLDN